MQRALALAKKGSGHTSPNPLVGAVLVKNGRIVGEGYHRQAGTNHAEVVALKKAGDRARGATLYVNLEPCCHVGLTPACTGALIKAGVKAVQAAVLDPNPIVSGNGKRALEKAGIKVTVGSHEAEARTLNEIFFKYIATKQPFVLAKWAMGLDSQLVTPPGQSKWISSTASQRRTHEIRQRYDAILVGVNTVIADDPSLTVRHGIKDPSHPLRIIVDSTGRTPLTKTVLNKNLPGKTLIATTAQMTKKRARQYERTGAEVLVVNRGRTVHLKKLMALLGTRVVTSVLIDGGATVLQNAFKADIVDKVMVFLAPKVIGGGTFNPQPLALSNRFIITATEIISNDLLITAYPQ